MTKTKVYTTIEEIFHALTHGVGAVLTIVGFLIMLVLSLKNGNPWVIASVVVFSVASFAVYISSTLYHSFPAGRIKKIFRVLDHTSIFLLIAGTYTPFLLVYMRNVWGWSLFGILWSLTVIGFFFKLFFTGKLDKLATIIYILMGWIALVAIKPAISYIPFPALMLMLVGGIFYTVGVLFYLWEKLPFHHVIWHLFVLSGTLVHFISIFSYVVLKNS
ncbi:MAG: hemolysin III family protein [Candidatus Hydrogenedentes bacterium]|nr:hemolysin III family protein [Candidatus Hydrogenedentota bacterium]